MLRGSSQRLYKIAIEFPPEARRTASGVPRRRSESKSGPRGLGAGGWGLGLGTRGLRTEYEHAIGTECGDLACAVGSQPLAEVGAAVAQVDSLVNDRVRCCRRRDGVPRLRGPAHRIF